MNKNYLRFLQLKHMMQLIPLTRIFSLFLIVILTSCAEETKHVKSDPFFERLKDGKASKNEIDSLLEANGVPGSYTVKIPKDHFEITFPVRKKYVEKLVSAQIIDGKEIKIYEHKANMQDENDKNLAYQLSYNYVGDLKTDQEIEQLFNEQRDYWLSGTNSNLEYEKITALKGVPGRQLYLTVDNSSIKMTGRMYYYKGIFYRFLVVTPDRNLFNKKISEFLDSFKILEEK